ncbi:NLP/P60 protein (plasmid) [Natrialba magadii ATCC 43099]|uniref:NLP/P60 protein n=1 Tax=Natrialba magadii (strain ATCC 43099 / DSM 3394 / CCM 3739 / CIP 104546 / IAM 13178 / JCM 8861 / NBRC 102185 / NCIMB 2190 / MS3) TaxID=547559 RepID=D3T0U6_NATMM|nr:NlpC/P60 family protein [Natrialba magadii]ADD07205.1 NLP/P60 protein [Natrialba magadii ATCC 43099]ELY34319.1 NLP/P60 protein [Natrialba magadii ATCC 43099]
MSTDAALETAASLAVQQATTQYAPDERAAVAAVDAVVSDDTVVLEGAVSTERVRTGVRNAVQEAVSAQSDDGSDAAANATTDATTDATTVRDELTVLESLAVPRTTRRRVVSVRGDPEEDAEQVTKALYGEALTAYDGRDGWCRVRTADGYLGWVDEEALCELDVTDEWEPDAAVATAPADAFEDEDRDPDSTVGLDTVPAGVECRIESDGTDAESSGTGSETATQAELVVSFRTGATARLHADAIRETAGLGTGDEVVSIARQFLETPYEWGGMTSDGIDCSGLVRIAYAAIGVLVPRDADQQSTLGKAVDRDELEPGDLLFFPGHVAISLGGDDYIHAYGSDDAVTINSLDPDDEQYVESLDESMTATKRLLPTDADSMEVDR